MKVVAALAALESASQNPYLQRFFDIESPFDGRCRCWRRGAGHLENLSFPNGKAITTKLSNHHGHVVASNMKTLEGTLVKSYNVYISYLGLLMDRSVIFDSNFLEKPSVFWRRTFASPDDRYRQFPLLETAAKLRYNGWLGFMFGKRKHTLLPEKSLRIPLVTIPGVISASYLSQESITRPPHQYC